MGGLKKTQNKQKFYLCVLKYDGQYTCSKYDDDSKKDAEDTMLEDEEVDYYIWSEEPLAQATFVEQMDFENKYLNSFHVESESDSDA